MHLSPVTQPWEEVTRTLLILLDVVPVGQLPPGLHLTCVWRVRAGSQPAFILRLLSGGGRVPRGRCQSGTDAHTTELHTMLVTCSLSSLLQKAGMGPLSTPSATMTVPHPHCIREREVRTPPRWAPKQLTAAAGAALGGVHRWGARGLADGWGLGAVATLSPTFPSLPVTQSSGRTSGDALGTFWIRQAGIPTA